MIPKHFRFNTPSLRARNTTQQTTQVFKTLHKIFTVITETVLLLFVCPIKNYGFIHFVILFATLLEMSLDVNRIDRIHQC